MAQKEAIDFPSLQEFIRVNEAIFFNDLVESADRIGIMRGWGRGTVWNPDYPIFTGYGLCKIASIRLSKSVREEFGSNSDIWVVKGTVEVPDLFHEYPDGKIPTQEELFFWNRFKANDGNSYFIAYYGQINPMLNRIVIDNVSNEDLYFKHVVQPVREKEL